MIDPDYARLMARYNRWQNRSIYAAAGRLDDAQRKAHRGAFFGSIHGTLNHLLWGDKTWMVRFADWPAPPAKTIRESTSMYESWDDLARVRSTFDQDLVAWADRLAPSALAGNITYFSGAAGRNITKPIAVLLVHFFNHQTHHRGQVHAMLTAAGAYPEDTDLFMLPEE